MRLYAGTSTQWEISSWRNSLRAVSDVFREANLDDHGVILEYQLPLSSRRLDCMIYGKDKKEKMLQ